MTPLADVKTLRDRLDMHLSAGQAVQAELLIRYASSLARGHARKVGVYRNWLDEDGVEQPPDGVAEVVVEVVFRAVQNPAGATQETTGPFNVSFGPDAAQRMYLTRGDKLIIGGQAAFTVNMADEETSAVLGGAKPFDIDMEP